MLFRSITSPTITGTVAGTPTISSPTLTTPSMTGPLTMTSGGITFNANPGGGAQATLNDYEVGTWTPTIDFGGNAVGVTYQSAVGTYVKVGKVVHIQAYVYLSSKGSSTGIMRFRSLPFTAQNVSNSYTSLSGYCGSATSVSGSYMFYTLPNTNSVEFYFSQTGTPGAFTNTNCNNNTDFIVSGTYITST